MSTKLILTQDVIGLGVPGDVVEVKDGFARNYLLPQGLATGWTKGAQRQIDQISAAQRKREIVNAEQARELREQLQGATVTVPAKAGPGGRLFGAVSGSDVANAIKAAGFGTVDRRRVNIEEPIKELGSATVTVGLYGDVTATVNLDVVAL